MSGSPAAGTHKADYHREGTPPENSRSMPGPLKQSPGDTQELEDAKKTCRVRDITLRSYAGQFLCFLSTRRDTHRTYAIERVQNWTVLKCPSVTWQHLTQKDQVVSM